VHTVHPHPSEGLSRLGVRGSVVLLLAESYMPEFRPAALIPTYNNPLTIERVVRDIRAHIQHVLVIDDGSGPEGRAACEAVQRAGLASVVHRERNGGKGAAVKTGLIALRERGFTHAFQVDADGQHAIADMPRFLAAAETNPAALVLGCPVFDASAPLARRWGRMLTTFWTHVETLGPVINDSMCGFRVYPLEPALRACARGDAMDFDPEIAVRIAWDGVPVLNLATRVRYVGASDGGVSHFRLFRDNVLISWMHTRMVMTAMLRVLGGKSRPRRVGA
jgi:polyprenyl-phospho-N-acetylgalactosaminyl synthase